MKLGVKTRYGVMAMIDIALCEKGSFRSMADIAESQSLPLPYLKQIIHKLSRANLLTSMMGSQGGYTLVRAPQEISIYDIMVAVEGPAKMTRCDGAGGVGCQPKGARCITHDLWDELGGMIASHLKSVKLSRFVGAQNAALSNFIPSKHTPRVIRLDGPE